MRGGEISPGTSTRHCPPPLIQLPPVINSFKSTILTFTLFFSFHFHFSLLLSHESAQTRHCSPPLIQLPPVINSPVSLIFSAFTFHFCFHMRSFVNKSYKKYGQQSGFIIWDDIKEELDCQWLLLHSRVR